MRYCLARRGPRPHPTMAPALVSCAAGLIEPPVHVQGSSARGGEKVVMPTSVRRLCAQLPRRAAALHAELLRVPAPARQRDSRESAT